MGDDEKVFSADELAEYDGQDGRPAYVGYQGKVYDVTDSDMWEDGDHMGLHSAGKDCTEDLEDAPHMDEVFDDFPVAGTLKD